MRRSALHNFDDHMVDHVKSFAPWHARAADTRYLHDAVRCGRERATRHGFSLRGPTRFYIELMCMLGGGFDTDPQYPWAARILAGATDDEFLRADQLHTAATRYVERVAGPE